MGKQKRKPAVARKTHRANSKKWRRVPQKNLTRWKPRTDPGNIHALGHRITMVTNRILESKENYLPVKGVKQRRAIAKRAMSMPRRLQRYEISEELIEPNLIGAMAENKRFEKKMAKKITKKIGGIGAGG